MRNIDDLIDNCASDVLETLSETMPDINDDGALGELVLMRALEAYRICLNL